MSNPSKPESEGTGGLQSKLLLVVSGVLIPLVAAAIPYIIEFISPKSSLVFESVGPVVVEDTKGFSLSVRNEGKTVERNIEVWLPSKLEKGNHKLESSQPLTLKEVDKATVLVLGDIRPSEKVLELPELVVVSVKMVEGGITLVSNGATKNIKPSEPEYFAWLSAIVRHYML